MGSMEHHSSTMDRRLETMSAVDIPPDFETYQARQKKPVEHVRVKLF